MSIIKTIPVEEWPDFLFGFSDRNRGRRARFEVFGPDNSTGEEVQEATFESAVVDGDTITVNRIDRTKPGEPAITDKFENIQALSVQYDTDESEVMLEMTNENGVMSALHFESLVDGDS